MIKKTNFLKILDCITLDFQIMYSYYKRIHHPIHLDQRMHHKQLCSLS